MEKQSKLLEPNYISARLNDFKEIKSKKIKYSIMQTENNSLYINLINLKTNKSKTIRISDKSNEEYKNNEFIIENDFTLDKSCKDKYMTFLTTNIKEVNR